MSGCVSDQTNHRESSDILTVDYVKCYFSVCVCVCVYLGRFNESLARSRKHESACMFLLQVSREIKNEPELYSDISDKDAMCVSVSVNESTVMLAVQ